MVIFDAGEEVLKLPAKSDFASVARISGSAMLQTAHV